MRINLELINKILEEQKKRDDLERSYQPDLVLGCFKSLGREDDTYCLKCSYYERCKTILEAVSVEEPVFAK